MAIRINGSLRDALPADILKLAAELGVKLPDSGWYAGRRNLPDEANPSPSSSSSGTEPR